MGVIHTLVPMYLLHGNTAFQKGESLPKGIIFCYYIHSLHLKSREFLMSFYYLSFYYIPHD